MTNNFLILLLAGALSLLGSTGKANDDQELCGLYGNIGRGVAEFMLPLTLQQIINMNSGNDPELQKESETKAMTYVTSNQLIAAVKLTEQEVAAFGESAGQNAVALLMEAKASSGMDIFHFLTNRCNRLGAQTVISNQIKAAQLMRGE